MTKEQREELRRLKHEINRAKSDLLWFVSEIARISPRQAEQLNRIIARLEAWQNQGR